MGKERPTRFSLLHGNHEGYGLKFILRCCKRGQRGEGRIFSLLSFATVGIPLKKHFHRKVCSLGWLGVFQIQVRLTFSVLPLKTKL